MAASRACPAGCRSPRLPPTDGGVDGRTRVHHFTDQGLFPGKRDRPVLDSARGGFETGVPGVVDPPSYLKFHHPAGRCQPLTVSDATTQAEDWPAQPAAVVVEPAARHLGIVQQLPAPIEAGCFLVNDAHLAALAIEHRCTVVSYDTNFLSFNGVKSETPTT